MSEEKLMLALVLKEKGILELQSHDIPVPKAGQVCVKVQYAGICGSDIHALHGLQPSLSFPCVLGHELVGSVYATPHDSTFAIGDRVVIDPSFRCGVCSLCGRGKENICEHLQVLGVHCDGGFAQYCVCDENMLYSIPNNLPSDVAVFCEPMSIAVHAVSRVQNNQMGRALIIGAGPIGLALLLYVKTLWKQVSVCDVLENRRNVALSVGADAVFAPQAIVGESSYDTVFDTVCTPPTTNASLRQVARGGDVIIVGMAKPDTGISLLPILKKELHVTGTRMTRPGDFAIALSYLSHCDVRNVRKIITHRFALSKGIEAMRYVENNPQESIKVIINCEEIKI